MHPLRRFCSPSLGRPYRLEALAAAVVYFSNSRRNRPQLTDRPLSDLRRSSSRLSRDRDPQLTRHSLRVCNRHRIDLLDLRVDQLHFIGDVSAFSLIVLKSEAVRIRIIASQATESRRG
ncbi:unnamed protein product [Sphagnum balticum]